MKTPGLFILFAIPLLSLRSAGSDGPAKEIPDNMKGIVERHNYWREQVGSPPLKWSDELAAYAQEWANELKRKNDCKMEHRPDKGPFAQQHGENLYWSKGKNREPGEVVDAWASELEFWNTETLECNKEWWYCGHYTQLVWHTSESVGCAMVKCEGGEELWVCNYNPPGNWVGEKPYIRK